MFPRLPENFGFPDVERAVLDFWKKARVFERSLELRRDGPRFVFYEGPPTANGLPHPGHCLTRAMKDLFPRYRTMCGYLCERKAGWDTHGLPVEIEVCKALGLHTKHEIEGYGLEPFVRKCIESVWRYVRQWEEMTERLGFWIDLSQAYATYHRSYVESVWWSLKTLFERGLLYQGHKVVWWWCQGGTALSAGEVGEGYRTVDDPSVYVKFPLVAGQRLPGFGDEATGEGTGNREQGTGSEPRVSLLVWTTTPWTLISNHFAAVHPDFEYVLVEDPGPEGSGEPEYYYLARELLESVQSKLKRELRVVGSCKGAELVGLRYVPPFDCYYRRLGGQTAKLRSGGEQTIGWRVLPADFVTLDTGTGIVHEAPAFGEVDFDLLQQHRREFEDPDAVPLLCAVNPDGTFNDDAPEAYRGRWIKDCDREIIRELRNRGLLLHQETCRHEYPFCPRAENDPLIQYARKSWFVRTSAFKDEFLKNNAKIRWLPEHIRDGRFGDFLRNNVDWALSRERYWGTPLPIWQCATCGHQEAIGSLDELRAKPAASDDGFWETRKNEQPELPDDLQVHRPYIDAWTYACPRCGDAGRMQRVPEVIDCWWDAGSMPFAQWGFPHAEESRRLVAERFPADFISEAIDQTRGWFYGLLAISTLLRDDLRKAVGEPAPPGFGEYPIPYRTCIVLGHMMGEDGLKMSKRKKNYREPSYIFDHYGADAMRWFFYSAQTPWTSVRFTEAAIRDAQREFLVKLYHVLSFFTIYANIDGFEPGASDEATKRRSDEGEGAGRRAQGAGGSPWRPVGQRSELDRWIVSELHRTIRTVRECMDRFENFPAAQSLIGFVDGLSNWYVRRSRDRFWRSVASSDAQAVQDKWDAYHTLYECLTTLSRVLAPFVPFFAEFMYQQLERRRPLAQLADGDDGQPVSVHLCDYPQADASLIDEALARQMAQVREIVSLGRAARTAAKIKVRQPIQRVEIVLARPQDEPFLRDHEALIRQELNVKQVEFAAQADQYVHYEVKPNFKAIGPKYGKLAPKIAAALKSLPDPAAARRGLAERGLLAVEVEGQRVELTPQEVEVRLEAKAGWSAAQGRVGVVVISTELTDELRAEGLVREFIHHVQNLRKEHNLPYEARITLYVEADDALAGVLRRYEDVVRGECLAQRIEPAVPEGTAAREVKVEGHAAKIGLSVEERRAK